MGRSLQNSIVNMGLEDPYHKALEQLGYDLEELYDQEQDAALGNGGLGRLASCFLDSLSTMNYPSWGYGLRYQFGMFKQEIEDGFQKEVPDFWLGYGNPWEIPRTDSLCQVRFFGHVDMEDVDGKVKYIWKGGDLVSAKPYDNPIPGYGTKHVSNLRLWESNPSQDSNYEKVFQGDYYEALKKKQLGETITSILYPNDNTRVGYELRLKQEYFFASSSIQDIIRRYKWVYGHKMDDFDQKTTIQLNDTHPAIAIVELMRILLDEEEMPWEKAWRITTNTFSYTNHTILPEALESWEVTFFEKLLPRHILITYEINRRFLEYVSGLYPNDHERIRKLSIFEECHPKRIRMANLSIIGSKIVNGVAEIHTEILKTQIFKEFYDLWPKKFICVTNGVTPRRWIDQANPSLSKLITHTLRHDRWLVDLDNLSTFRQFADNIGFQDQFMAIKLRNKRNLSRFIKVNYGISVNPHALFDMQVKRIHEYKRQFLNIIGVIARYIWIKTLNEQQRSNVVPRVVIFSGKAAPGYIRAKNIIKLINAVSKVIAEDEDVNELLKVIFLKNYNVSLAELIIPAADISQHISTAGTEASGTSNMKFAMNGSLILGTLDGANVEIKDEVSEDNMFIFGTLKEEVETVRKKPPRAIDDRLLKVLQLIQNNHFGDFSLYSELVNELWVGTDYYLIGEDFPEYIRAQERVDEEFKDRRLWTKKCILTMAGMGKFSSDRSIRQYAEKIWGIDQMSLEENETSNNMLSTKSVNLNKS